MKRRRRSDFRRLRDALPIHGGSDDLLELSLAGVVLGLGEGCVVVEAAVGHAQSAAVGAVLTLRVGGMTSYSGRGRRRLSGACGGARLH